MNRSNDLLLPTNTSTKPPMKKSVFFLALVSIFMAASGSQATTVIPPTFDDLVTKAEIIFQGAVTDVKSQWIGEGAERRIVTFVTFKVDDSIKGAPGEQLHASHARRNRRRRDNGSN